MTTTAQVIAASTSPTLRYTVHIEGIPILFSTATPTEIDDPGEIKDSFVADAGMVEWGQRGASYYGACSVEGLRVSESIQLLAPKVSLEKFNVRVFIGDTSYSSGIPAYLVAPQPTSALFAAIAADVTPTATTITVQPRMPFAAAGTIYIGPERITYTGVTTSGGMTASFTGCTRGTFSSHIQTGGWAHYHRIDTVTGNAPVVSTSPRTGILGRMLAVHVIARHGEGSTARWSVGANALRMAVGRVTSAKIEPGGAWMTLSCESAPALLAREIFGEQFTGDVARGMVFVDGMSGIAVEEGFSSDTAVARNIYCTTLSGTGQRQGWDSLSGQKGLLGLVNDSLQAMNNAGSITMHMDASLKAETDRWRISIHASATGTAWAAFITSANSATMRIGLHPDVWWLLGWPVEDGRAARVTDVSGTQHAVVWRDLQRGAWASSGSNTMDFSLTAPDAPVDYFVGNTRILDGEVTRSLDLEEPQGNWRTQPVLPTGYDVPATTQGFAIIGDCAVYACSYDGGTKRMSLLRDMTHYFVAWGFSGGGLPEQKVIRRGDAGRVTVKQIWFERGALDAMARRWVYSTGLADYNGTSDDNPPEMGAAVPTGLIDDDSFNVLGSRTATVLLLKAEKVDKLLSSACALVGAHLAWSFSTGKLRFVHPKLSGTTIAEASSYQLTENNKATPDDHPSIEYGTDGIINVLQLKSGRGLDGNFKNTTIIEALTSIGDYGVKRTATMEGLVIGPDETEVQTWVEAVSGEVMTMLSRPHFSIARTLNATGIGLEVGAVTTVTDGMVYDPRTGALGIDALPCVVTGMAWDLESMTASIQVMTIPELAYDQMAPWAPSAEMTYGAGGYVVVSGSSRYLQCTAHAFSHSADSVDVANFAAGDVIDIRERSPATAASPAGWTAQVVESVDTANSRIYLTAALAGFSAVTRYTVGYSAVTSVVAAQRSKTFVADDVQATTGLFVNDAFYWGSAPTYPGSIAATTYTTEYVRPANILDDIGRPLDVGVFWDLVASYNNLLGHKLRSPVILEQWATARNGMTLYGPVWAPLMHHGTRSLICRLQIASGSGANRTYEIMVSAQMPKRSLGTALAWNGPYISASASTTSLTPVWSAELTINPDGYTTPGELPGVWIAVRSTNIDNRRLYGLSIVEGPIT